MPVAKKIRKAAASGHADSRLLTPAEERRLAAVIQRGLAKCADPLSRRNPAAVLKRHGLTEALAAFNRMCLANQRLVISVAKRYAPPPPFDFADLIQAGNCGLIVAIARFNPRRGYRFSTYATWRIRHSIGRWLEDSRQTVRLPVGFQKFDAKLRRAESVLRTTLGRAPTAREAAEALKVGEGRVLNAWRVRSRPIVSLNNKLDADERAEYLEALRSRDGDPLDAMLAVEREEACAIVRRAIEQLDDPFEVDAIRSYFGFVDEDRPMTLAEIGRRHGLSRERTRVRKNRALEKLRVLLARQGLEAL